LRNWDAFIPRRIVCLPRKLMGRNMESFIVCYARLNYLSYKIKLFF